jgi:hypothetical protein
MTHKLTTILGSLAALSMVVAGLWSWNDASNLAAQTTRPDVTLWALRSAGVCLGAAAQAMILTFIVSRIYRRDLFVDVLRLFAGVIAAVALVSAIALGLAGR